MSEPTSMADELMASATAAPSTQVSVLIKQYLKLRNARDAFDERVKARRKPVTDAMQKIEGLLQAHLEAAGVNNMASSDGTAFLKHKDSTTVSNRAELLAWLAQTHNWHLVDLKANTPAVREFIDKSDQLPPGVTYRSAIITQVQAR